MPILAKNSIQIQIKFKFSEKKGNEININCMHSFKKKQISLLYIDDSTQDLPKYLPENNITAMIHDRRRREM